MKWKDEGPMYGEPGDSGYDRDLKELEETGIAGGETYSMDHTFIDFMLPRLKLFLVHSEKTVLADEMHADIRTIIAAFETYDEHWFDNHEFNCPEFDFEETCDENFNQEFNEHMAVFSEALDKTDCEEWETNKEAEREEALDLLRKHFRSLWW